MLYQNVCIETFAHRVPEEVITSEQIEERLAPLYERLRLPEGRLELISGIATRGVWPEGVLPGEVSIETGALALEKSGIDRQQVGALIHGSVCRDFLEPATACRVHHRLDLPTDCMILDVSNACLGILNGMVLLANMIELGQVRAGLVVGTESSRSLLDMTIDRLNADMSLTRKTIKSEIASLTIGSGSAAVLLTHRDISKTGNRLLGGVAVAETSACELCQSEGMETLMRTDSEQLLQAGIAAVKPAFEQFLEEVQWTREDIDRVFSHQVGSVHRRLMLEALQIEEEKDYAIFPEWGNTGATALPMATSMGIDAGHVREGEKVGLLGIGSGVNVLMLAAQFDQIPG